MYNFLIIDTYYNKFLEHFYRKIDVSDKKYEEHVNLLFDKLFGTANFYSKNLKLLGCEAREVIFNDFNLQYKWAKEYGLRIIFPAFCFRAIKWQKIINRLPSILWGFDERYKILKSQIKYYKPEVLYIQDISTISDKFLSEIKDNVRLIVGQIASPIPKNRNLKVYDLIFTSFPHFVGKFKNLGINVEFLKIAFEPSILEIIRGQNLKRKYNLTFVGGLTKSHKNRIKILSRLAKELDIDFWGYGIKTLPIDSPIRKRYHGEVWGIDMYHILLQSKMTINTHINVAENYANNMRLYEATGCGAMLITDYKDNLGELFKIGKELVCYKNIEELIELIKYYATNDKERKIIAKNGQRRTLTEHTYFNRMKEMLDILKRYL